MALAVGRQVLHVQISGQPYCRYTATEAFGHQVLITLAPNVVDGRKTPPTKEVALTYLRKVRQNTHGNCDSCSIAETLRAAPAVVTDDMLAEAWLDDYRKCVDFFEHPDVRAELNKLAAELREKRMMSGEEVHALVDEAALRAAFQSINSKS
jgi:hypothetical protein